MKSIRETREVDKDRRDGSEGTSAETKTPVARPRRATTIGRRNISGALVSLCHTSSRPEENNGRLEKWRRKVSKLEEISKLSASRSNNRAAVSPAS